VVEAIRNDPEWKNGDYEQQPHGYARIAPLNAMMVGSPSRQYEMNPTKAEADAWYEHIIQVAYAQVDAVYSTASYLKLWLVRMRRS